jgi:hypothetical protein
MGLFLLVSRVKKNLLYQPSVTQYMLIVSSLAEDAEIDAVIDPSETQSLDPMAQYRASKIASYKAVLEFAA